MKSFLIFVIVAPLAAQQQKGFSVEEKPAEVLEKAAGVGERYALLIGVSRYSNPSISLNFAAADARALSDVLLDPAVGAYKPENVRLLVDELASRKNIVSALSTWLGTRVKPEDSVIIFFSGHGALGNGSEAFWVTHDADVEDLAASALSNKEISNLIGALRCKRKLTLIDSCFSEATARKYRAVVPRNVFDEFKGQGVVTVTASNGQQKSVEVGGHGAFTFHLLDALQGKADKNENGVVELDEVWSYLNDKVQKTAADAGNRQTPVLMAERLEHGFPLTINPMKAAGAVLASLRVMYSDGSITLQEMAEAEKLFNDRQGSTELRNLYKGLSEKALAVNYFRQLRQVLVAGAAPPAGGSIGAPPAAILPPGVPAQPGASGAELESFRIAEAANTTESWLRFLQTFPQGYLAPAARTKLEEQGTKRMDTAAYNVAKGSDAEKAWEQYLVQFPNGAYATEAQRRVAELKQKREAELSAFRLADAKGGESSWERFLKEFPTGQLALIAEDRLENLRRAAREKEDATYAIAMKSNAVADWDRYLSEYPSGRYAQDATRRRADVISKIEAERERKAEADLYLRARNTGALANWSEYLTRYPTGPNAAEAARRIEQIKWIAFAETVAVPRGTFTMGSERSGDEKPRHRVEVDAFRMGAGEVTNAQYLKFAEETSHAKPADPQFSKGYMQTHPQLPVVNVTYEDALAFCKWLSQKTGANVRLPTEAEWEYAALGGKEGAMFPWGMGTAKTLARYKDNHPSGSALRTVARPTFAPNGYGLYNMAGNVAEWVLDYYGEHYYKTSAPKNPTGPSAGKEHVVRGGSWNSGDGDLRCSKRAHHDPNQASDQIGFRVVIVAK